MKTAFSVLVLLGFFAFPAAAEEQKPAAPASEASQKWKGLKAQEEWVARLKKQIQGESAQLDEMRASLAQAFKLDVKKLEAGLYDFDEKSGAFLEKKPAA